jgi:hypothetical protein
MGSRLIVLDARDDGRWLRVSAPDGYRAWVRAWGTCVPNRRYEEGLGVFVTIPHAILRDGPAKSAGPVTPLWMGCGLTLTGRTMRGSREAVTPDGRSGWIGVEALERDERPALAGFWDPPLRAPRFGASRARIRVRALSLLGTPYRWGGTTPGGIDCSGFVRLVFGLEGTVLPRDAREQESALRDRRVEIPPARLRAGEIVFFGPRRGGATHAGIGIGGRSGRFIHASGRVRISGLDPRDPLFEADLARRVRSVVRP